MRNVLSFLAPIAVIGAVAVPLGLWSASKPAPVYAAPFDFVVTRPVPVDGMPDRIVITTTIRKLQDCDVEAGIGKPYAVFHDKASFVSPASTLRKANGEPAGQTRGGKGSTFRIEGYTAEVPEPVKVKPSTFTVMVPCKLYTLNLATGLKDWGDDIVATYGPISVPDVGGYEVDPDRERKIRSGKLKVGELK